MFLMSKFFLIKNAMSDGEISSSLWNSKPTRHFKERKERISRVGGIGNIVAGFVVDEKHEKGDVEHFITDNGMILVLNHKTKLAVTIMIARPEQIKRYFENGEAPEYIVEKAHYNSYVMGWNY